MADAAASGIRHVPISEVATRVAELRSTELDLFELLSAQALSTDDSSSKPVLATWAHRHAWHAQLWADRFPSIPGVSLDRASMTGTAVDRTLGDLVERCAALRDDVDDMLDPSTVRVCDLVLADLQAEVAELGRCFPAA